MRITVTTLSEQTFVLEVPDLMPLKDFKDLCVRESGIQSSEMVVLFNGRPLLDVNRKLKEYGLRDGEFVVLLQVEMLRLAAAPNRQQQPNQQRGQQSNQQQHPQQQVQRVQEVPAHIREQLRRQKEINDNMEAALEHNPEMFGVVHMLYINCKINGYPTKAFVDSGAQTTLMSLGCAKRVNLINLVDTRFSGVATGIGTQRIIGRIHMVQIQIERDFLVSSFCILQNQPMDVLIGLDMLRRHQCLIDLKKNILKIGTTGSDTPFLPENELPEFARGSPPPPPPNQSKQNANTNTRVQALTSSKRNTSRDGPSTSKKKK